MKSHASANIDVHRSSMAYPLLDGQGEYSVPGFGWRIALEMRDPLEEGGAQLVLVLLDEQAESPLGLVPGALAIERERLLEDGAEMELMRVGDVAPLDELVHADGKALSLDDEPVDLPAEVALLDLRVHDIRYLRLRAVGLVGSLEPGPEV